MPVNAGDSCVAKIPNKTRTRRQEKRPATFVEPLSIRDAAEVRASRVVHNDPGKHNKLKVPSLTD